MEASTQISVREALQGYFRAAGLPPDGGISARLVQARVGPVILYFPNFNARRAALRFHDAHHVLLAADTSLRGEAVVAGFEVGAGCGRYWVSWFFELQALAWGMLLCPRDAYSSYLLGRASSSLYQQREFLPEWLDATPQELRDLCKIPSSVISSSPLSLVSFAAAAACGLILLAGSITAVVAPVAAVFYCLGRLLGA